MLLIKNVSKRKVYINDLRVLLQPQETLDLDTYENFVRNNSYSSDLNSLVDSGNISILASSRKEETTDNLKTDLRDMLSEILSDLIQPGSVKSTKEPIVKQKFENLDIGEINAMIHSQSQIQDGLKESRINIQETDIEDDTNTCGLVELLRKQKKGAKDV